jgi:hypothetical protein
MGVIYYLVRSNNNKLSFLAIKQKNMISDNKRPIKKFRSNSGEAKEAVIRIKQNTKSDLQFIRGIIVIHPRSSDGDII